MLTYSDGAAYAWEMARRFAGPNQTMEIRHLMAGILALKEAEDQPTRNVKNRFTLLEWQRTKQATQKEQNELEARLQELTNSPFKENQEIEDAAL